MSLKLNLDIPQLSAQLKEFALDIEREVTLAAKILATQTHAKIAEEYSRELEHSREEFLRSLHFEEISSNVWSISIDESGLWIEEGIKPDTDMKPGLLKKNAKTSKDGHRYKVIPFDYGGKPSTNSVFTQNIVDEIKKNLKKAKVSFGNIERHENGSPKIGKLHSFNFGNPGGRMGGPGKGNTPIMNGLSIYQTLTKTGNVRRDVMTFRTVSDSPASADKWFHPGLKGKKFLDRALEFASREWEDKLLPEILKKWSI